MKLTIRNCLLATTLVAPASSPADAAVGGLSDYYGILSTGIALVGLVVAFYFGRRSKASLKDVDERFARGVPWEPGASSPDNSRDRVAERLPSVDINISQSSRDDLNDDEDSLLESSASAEITPPSVPVGLVDACAHANVILFVGASTRIRERAPSWQLVLGAALDQCQSKLDSGRQRSVRRLLKRGEYDSVADIIEQAIGREAFVEIIGNAYLESEPSEALTTLCSGLPLAGCLSTGLDHALERAGLLDSGPLLTARSGADFEQYMGASRPFVLQLTGIPEVPGSMCLTQAQLRAALNEAPDLRSLLLSLLSARTLLFVGMTVQEIEFLWDLLGFYGSSSQLHYALIHDDPDFAVIADRYLSRYNIELLQLGAPDHLDIFADDLVRHTRERRQELRPGQADGPLTSKSISIQRVRLQNIGPFVDVAVDFPSHWTMVLGNNGAGKSTILRAIALVLAGTDQLARNFARSLLKRGQKLGTIELTLNTVPTPTTYRTQLTLEGGRVNLTTGVSPLQAGSVVAFGFPAVRGITSAHAMEIASMEIERLPRVSDVLPLLQGGFDERVQNLRHWIRSNYAASQDEALPAAARARHRAMIDSFFKLVDGMAPGFDLAFSRCDPQTSEILLQTSDGEVPLDYVSQGMSSMIGWAGTFIQRLYDINGDDSDPKQAAAILLIDEIDSHLHPEWQQRLVPVLRDTFPNVQMIATTHSALMVGSLEAQEVVRVVRAGDGLRVENIDQSFKGYRVDQILTDEAFGLKSARDPDWQALRREYATLLGVSDRDAQQEQRYLELDDIMEQVPPPFESRRKREAYHEAVANVDEAIKAGRDAQASPIAGA